LARKNHALGRAATSVRCFTDFLQKSSKGLGILLVPGVIIKSPLNGDVSSEPKRPATLKRGVFALNKGGNYTAQ
jgi:hypothetical protein